MIMRVVIRDNRKSPLHYLEDLENFANGREYVFKPGVNVIVGENGCGKTTLMNLIKSYLMVDLSECSRGQFNKNINYLFNGFGDNNNFYDGVDVYADYSKNTFRLSHKGERIDNDEVCESHRTLAEFLEQNSSSTGESVVVALNSLFNLMFGKEAKLKFDYHDQFEEIYPQYVEYVEKHRVICDDEWTILMDEPDRNLSLENLSQIKSILSFHKPNTQIIAVVHNPLLICALSKKNGVNFIEMTDGYIDKVRKEVSNLMR